MKRIKNYSEEDLIIIRNGGLIAFPTETVYGFGVIFDNKKAYDRLIEVKRRPPDKPFTLMCGKTSDIKKYAYINDTAKKIINAFLPGELTIILKGKEDLPSWVVSKEGNVGIRVPNNKFIQDFINDLGKPMLVPSANRSGEPPLNKAQEVASIFENELDLLVEGEATSKVPSTIVLVDNDVKILREGRISKEQILSVIK